MAKPASTKRVFEVRAAETRAPRRIRRVQVSVDASLQQLHLALLAAFDYRAPYTSADREFAIASAAKRFAYATDALRPLRDVFAEGSTATYASTVAGLRATLEFASERAREPRVRYPRIYEGDATAPDPVLTDEARFAASYRYLKNEPRPDSAAYRHGIYAAAVAGPMLNPTEYLECIAPLETHGVDELKMLLEEPHVIRRHRRRREQLAQRERILPEDAHAAETIDQEKRLIANLPTAGPAPAWPLQGPYFDVPLE
ncbi:MAG TPA: hypothetical protein VFB22_05665 [Candidatus Baltobacteraceae bacterium]|nr:hypothetical protein [Candidatus Baltobacteraceae bacterium]